MEVRKEVSEREIQKYLQNLTCFYDTSKLKRVLSFQSGEDTRTAGRLEQKIEEERNTRENAF